MDNKLLISKYEEYILTSFYENGSICQFLLEQTKKDNILSNIYIGKVRNIVKNINAAFVEFEKGQMGYLSLDEKFVPVHTRGIIQDDSRVLIGDEIIVQVTKEAVKTKPPTLKGKLDFSGKFVVVTYGSSGVSVSRKIRDKDRRLELKELLTPFLEDNISITARTNSANASSQEILRELNEIKKKCDNVTVRSLHKEKFTCIYKAPDAYLASIRDMYEKDLSCILTDNSEIFDNIKSFLTENGWDKEIQLKLWDKKDGKMEAVYNIKKNFERALNKKVWLKSGGYIIIEPTEALISIDVNTGKAISKKKDVQKTFLKINREAAYEIARQLRLRNLSGMILVDFIDMSEQDANNELMETLRLQLSKDQIPTKVVDMTGLGLVEITRKKVRKPLYEQIEKHVDLFSKKVEEENESR